MVVAPGAHFGPYEIQAAIGAGGMGEVWRARDTRLDRTVAIATPADGRSLTFGTPAALFRAPVYSGFT